MSAVVTAPAGAETGQARSRTPRRRRRWTRFILPAYSWLVIAYLVFPIAVMVLYSFNKVTAGLPQVSFAWNGFTTQWYQQWKDIPQLTLGVLAVHPAGDRRHPVRHGNRHPAGAGPGPLPAAPLPRPGPGGASLVP